jgi:anti-sigma regulatory factor (Ser/Thr protein kinase)/GNAT superfamily N-acetyltransferase
MEIKQGEQQVSRITCAARLEFLPAVLGFVRETSVKIGLSAKEAERLELVVEEACLNVIEHAFDPEEPGAYDVVILRRPGQIIISVEDRGLPFDFKKYEASHESSLGIILMKAFADEVRFLNLGREGKRVELIKHLPYQDISAYVSADEEVLSPSVPALPEDIPITVRRTEPADSMDLARCIYRCYGYTYTNDYIYYPDRVKELLESGLLLSYIALNPKGEVIGHIAIKRDSPDAHVGDGGQGVVDPRYRGNGFLGKLILSFVEYARQNGIYGAYTEAVTIHPFSQKAVLAMGGFETGALLGFIPANIAFKGIKGDTQKRQTVVLMYTSINTEPARNVYPPLHHEAIIRDIYGKSKLERNIVSASDYKGQAEMPAQSKVNVRVAPESGQAYIQVIEFGADLDEMVKFRLNELCLRRIDCIYLDLPLSDPAVQKSVAALEMRGFFFGGVIPGLYDGDILRLQYLNNVDLKDEQIQTASDYGKCLVEYVLKARERS